MWGRPQVIAVTANVMDTDVEACKVVGMVDFIAKPIKIDKLKEVLERCSQPNVKISINNL